MNKINHLLSFVFILFFSANNCSAYAEKIVYIDMDKIMQISKAGKDAISKINDQKKKDVSKFQKIEKELKSREEDLITKKNVISAEEFNKKFLGEIPINSDIGKYGDQGKPIVESMPDHDISKLYLKLADQIKSIYL